MEPKLETLEHCMKLSQMIVQGLWDIKSPLLQLPHIKDESLRHFVTKRVSVNAFISVHVFYNLSCLKVARLWAIAII